MSAPVPGEPSEQEPCPDCEGTGRYRDVRYWGTMPGSSQCPRCGGTGTEPPNEAGPQGAVQPCPYCEAKGCPECDNTGQRVRTHIDAGDGLTFSVSGSAPLNDEAREALAAVARAAYAQMDREPTGGEG